MFTSKVSLLQLAYWAKAHPVAARWAIAFNRITLGFIFFYIGAWLANTGQVHFKAAFALSASAYAMGFLLYPRRKHYGRRVKDFARQKFCDGLLLASSCIFWWGVGNYTLQWQPTQVFAYAPVEVIPSAIAKDKTGKLFPFEHAKILTKAKEKRNSIYKKIKGWKQVFFKKVKSRVDNKFNFVKSRFGKEDGWKIALLILISLAIIFILGYLTAGLACTLSCNGQEALAAIVSILGLGLIAGAVFLLWWHSILKNRKKKEASKLKHSKAPPASEPGMLKPPASVFVDNPQIRVCFEAEGESDLEEVTIRSGEVLLADKVLLGKSPYCVNLWLKAGIKSPVLVSGKSGRMKMVIEDGDLKKQLSVPLAGEEVLGIDLILKEK